MAKSFLFPSAVESLCSLENIENAGKDDTPTDFAFASFQTDKNKEEEIKMPVKSENSTPGNTDEWESDTDLKRKKPTKKKKKKSKKKHSHSQKNHKEHNSLKKPHKIWLDEVEIKKYIYRKDKNPDIKNVEYNGLYKMDIALCYPAKTCIGMNLDQLKLYKFNIYKKKKRNNSEQRYFQTDLFQSASFVDNGKNRFSHQITNNDFISLSNPKEIDHDSVENEADKNSQYYNEKNKGFSEKLLTDPNNIKTWLEFVEYQNEYLGAAETDIRETKFEKILIDKKLSILEKALLKNSTSGELIIYQMNLLKDVSPSRKVMEKWKEILFRFPNRSQLWREYLQFLQTDLISMKVSSVVDAYRKSFQMLIGILKGSIKSHQAEDYAVDQLFLLLIQFVIFLWQAGHTEKVVCMLECLIEFNLFHESKSNCDLDMKKAEFEQFFESGLPRFGELKATGWKQTFLQSDKSIEVIQYVPKLNISFEDKLKAYQNQSQDVFLKSNIWVNLENNRTFSEFLPFTGNMDECDDTERIVLYDDVSPVLFNVPNEDFHFQLVLVYLFILGVPIDKNMMSQQIYECFCKYFLIRNGNDTQCYCHTKLATDYVSINSLLSSNENSLNELLISKVRQIFKQSVVMFNENHQRYLSQIWFHFESIFFRKQFENLMSDLSKKYWKEVRKFYKSLFRMKSNRNNIALWEMYALHEKHVGNEEDCGRVYITSLQLCHQQVAESVCVSPVATIVRSMIESRLHVDEDGYLSNITRDEKSVIMNFYVTFVNPSKLPVFILSSSHQHNVTDLLKISSLFKSFFGLVISKKYVNNTYLPDFLYCYTMFQYLFNGVDSLLEVSHEFLKLCHGKSTTAKNYCGVYVLILMILKGETVINYHYFTYYKKILHQMLDIFPNNPFFNHWFILLKQNGLNSLNARRLYEKNVLTTNTIEPWLYYIKYEEKRLESVTLISNKNNGNFECIESTCGLYQRVKHLYDRLLKKDQFRYCADLWLQYFRFALKYKNKKGGLDVLNKALSSCCGAKVLIMKACENVDMFQEFYDLLIEKELRVKLLVEELDILLQQ